MATRNQLLVPIICLLLATSTTIVFARSGRSSNSSVAVREGRNWAVAIPLWIPGYRGQFAIGDIEIDGENSGGSGFLGRIFDSKWRLNFFFMGAFSYERARWRLHGDVYGGKFTDDVIFRVTGTAVAGVSVRPVISRLSVAYRASTHTWGDSGRRSLEGWIYAGARYYDVGIEANVSRFAAGIEDRWADPIVGVRLPVDVSRRWFAELAGDVGGFRVGSDLSWQVMGTGTWQATPLVSLTVGYNILHVDYRSTVASQEFRYRVQVGGPIAGIRFNF